MRFYEIGECPLMGHSEKHFDPFILGGIINRVNHFYPSSVQHTLGS
jgi:hypothetical protein